MAYDLLIKTAQIGQIEDTPFTVVESYISGGEVDFGRPLMRGVPPETIALRYNALEAPAFIGFLGVSVYTATSVPTAQHLGGHYEAQDTISVLTAGRFWTTLNTGLTIKTGDYCYLVKDVGVFNGDFTNLSSPFNITIGRFLTGGVSDGLTGNNLFLIELQTGFSNYKF